MGIPWCRSSDSIYRLLVKIPPLLFWRQQAMTLDRTGVRSDPPSDGNPLRRTAWGLFALGALFLLWRFPTMWCQPGGQDEECYAVPGLTILTSGRPQMPQLPVRDTRSVFYRSDDAVYLEPPFFFYFQSLFYAVLPDTPTGRPASPPRPPASR